MRAIAKYILDDTGYYMVIEIIIQCFLFYFTIVKHQNKCLHVLCVLQRKKKVNIESLNKEEKLY